MAFGRTIVRIVPVIAAIVFAALTGTTQAGAPQCYPWNSSGYCQYTGLVARAYANSGNWLLLYFDTPMDLNAPATVGLSGVTVNSAALYVMTENPDFAKALYASLLSAQARGATVTVQMSTVEYGYLHIDNIWVNP